MGSYRFVFRLVGAAILVVAAFVGFAPASAHHTGSHAAWGCPMCETIREDHPGTCPLCGMELIRMGVPAGGETPQRALMPGLPGGLFYGMVVAILSLSFGLFAWTGGRATGARGRRWDLFRIPGLKNLFRHPRFLPAVRWPIVLLFFLVVAAGLFGNPSPERNIAPVLTWTIWWAWLIFVILVLGKVWCTVCPWVALADWAAALPFLRRVRDAAAGRRWPASLRNIWLATGLFVVLTWLELGYGVTQKPWLTASLGLLMVLLALLATLAFERKAFCRYACLVGRVSGLYATFASSELRVIDELACRSCGGKDCYHGNERGSACPTHQFLGSMKANTYCTLCLECVKSCPKDNVAWNLRPPASDLLGPAKPRADEAYLAVILLSMSAFHGLTMTPGWDQFVAALETTLGVSRLAAFSLGMAGMLVAPVVVYYALCGVMKWLARDRVHDTKELFIRFSYSLLPIALFYHLAHNLQHIAFEGKKLVRAASDPFGWDWNLFGTAHIPIDALIPVRVGWTIQVALILVGHVYALWIAHRTAAALYGERRTATVSQVPMLLGMLLFSCQSLWLLSQPMTMRTAM